MKTFIRTEHTENKIEGSWYDKNGRRYSHKYSSLRCFGYSTKDTDDEVGYMAYAKKNNFKIIDNFKGKHPKRLKCL